MPMQMPMPMVQSFLLVAVAFALRFDRSRFRLVRSFRFAQLLLIALCRRSVLLAICRRYCCYRCHLQFDCGCCCWYSWRPINSLLTICCSDLLFHLNGRFAAPLLFRFLFRSDVAASSREEEDAPPATPGKIRRASIVPICYSDPSVVAFHLVLPSIPIVVANMLFRQSLLVLPLICRLVVIPMSRKTGTCSC